MPRIYVACLASDNAGILHGRWIEASSDYDAMLEEIEAMLAESPSPDAEEWAIHDSEGIKCSENDLQAVADYCQLIEDLEGDFQGDADEIVAAFGECFGDGTADQIRDAYRGQYRSEKDYAEQLVDDLGYLDEIPEHLRYYFDYEAFARDLFISDFVMSKDGHVFDRNW